MSGKGIKKKVWDVANCQSAVVFTGTGTDAKETHMRTSGHGQGRNEPRKVWCGMMSLQLGGLGLF